MSAVDLNSFRMRNGSPVEGEVLTSDASGNARWEPPGGTCPSGYADLGSYCIERSERGATTWHSAASACVSSTAKLCSPAEFYVACSRGLLSGGTNGWEWVDDYVGHYNWMGIVGNGSCPSIARIWPTYGGVRYRCCTNK